MAAGSVASPLKVKLIAGAWATGAGIAGVVGYRHLRDFEERAPCVREAARRVAASEAARRVLGAGELSLARWPRQSSIDLAGGRARASFELRGPAGHTHVILAARRTASAQAAWEESREDEEEAGSGWRYYWSRPWELKLLLLNRLRGSRRGGAEAEEAEATWDIETLFFLPNGDARSPTVLLGDASCSPEYETLCLRRDAEAKSDASRRFLQRALGLVTAGALLAAGLRLRKSVKVSRSYGFAKRIVLAHQDVAAALGRAVNVQSYDGTFNARFINGRMRLTNDAGAVADVEISALRDGGGSGPWRVVLARMVHAGRTHNLDKSGF